MPTPNLRMAREGDAAALAALSRELFIHTFVEDFSIPYPESDLRTYLANNFGEEDLRQRLVDPAQAWWVLEKERQLVGFVNAGPNSLLHPEAKDSHAELRRLYLARSVQGMGFGRLLVETALPWMEAHTDGPLWIGVWSGNERAQRLYARYGFERVGGYRYPVGSWFDEEHILRRP